MCQEILSKQRQPWFCGGTGCERHARGLLQAAFQLRVIEFGNRADGLTTIDQCFQQRQAFNIAVPVEAALALAAFRNNDLVTFFPDPQHVLRYAGQAANGADSVFCFVVVGWDLRVRHIGNNLREKRSVYYFLSITDPLSRED